MIRTRYRHLARMKEIVNILTKHGLEHVLDITGWGEGLLGRYIPKPTQVVETMSPAIRMRTALEELGPTFVKLGQLLSTRPDLIAQDYIHQLEKLQDQVQPTPIDLIIDVLEKELGLPYHKVFSEFDTNPLASASIGQVHKGTLITGEHVVIKIQRPGISEVIKTDLEIFFDIARVVQSRTKWGRFYKVVDVAEELAKTIREEIDYSIEGRNADRLASNTSTNPEVKIPKVYWEHSTSEILIMEFVDSIKINDLEAITKAGLNKEKTARNLANSLFKQIYIDGFYHADPHPGNLGVITEEKIVYMDFGMMGRIDEDLKDKFVELVMAVVRQDVGAIVELLLDIGKAHGKVNRSSLKRDISSLINKYYNLPLSQLKIGDVLKEMFSMAYQYQIKIPVEVTLLAKTLITLEGILPQLDPEISVVELAEPFAKELLKRKYSPGNIKKMIMKNSFEFIGLINHLPKRLDRILSIIEEGDLKLELEHRHISKILLRLNIISNRLSFSIIIGSLIIGSSLVAQNNHNSLLWKYPLAELGFIVAVIMGMWLLFSILRSGRI